MEDCGKIKPTCCLAETPSLSLNEEEEEGEYIESEIEITVNSIENIIRDDTLLLKMRIEHGDTLLGESQEIKIYSSYESLSKVHSVNFTIAFPYSATNMKSIAPLVSTPFLIKVFELTVDTGSESQSFEQKSPSNSRRPSKVELKLLGLCNVDLLPVILGEVVCDEKIILEVPKYSWNDCSVSWTNLPRISVTMSQSVDSIIAKNINLNFLNITIESMYNLPSHFTEDLEYKCGTAICTSNLEESIMIFEDGKWTDFRDIERTKTWLALQKLDSRAKFSKYKVNCDYDTVKNDFKDKFNLKAAVKKNGNRIEWNTIHRVLLETEDEQSILEQLQKYRHWPFEILVAQREIDTQSSEFNGPSSVIYQCYADVNQLFFPGRTKARVLAQLHTRSMSEMSAKTGLGLGIFGSNFHCSASRKSKLSEQSELDYEEVGEECYPLYADNGAPVLMLFEFELYRPFFPARVLEDYSGVMESLKNQSKPRAHFYAYTPDVVYDQYINCISKLVDFIGECYRDFTAQCDCQNADLEHSATTSSKPVSGTKNSCKPCNIPSSVKEETNCPYSFMEDELSRFKQFLHETGNYVSIRSALKSKVISLLDQKCSLHSAEWFSTQNQNFIASCYTYLVEHMHIALNKKLDVRLAEPYPDKGDFKLLWIRAEEAYEFGDPEKNGRLIEKVVCDNRRNPESWLTYAAYFMKLCNVDEAMICCREAISLNSRHKIALLFYGIILAMKEEYEDAEIFLKSVTYFYPRFAEGWSVLHLYYVKTQYLPGIDITLAFAQKCLTDRCRGKEAMVILNEEPIAWSTMLCRRDRIFLLTAILLLKLNLFTFADLALSQEICHGERSVEFLFFHSVNYYLQGDYEAAFKHLIEAESIIGLDYSIVSLLGHAMYKMGNIEKAVERYEAVDMLYDRPDNIHLVHLRMGFHYIDIEQYERAKCIFLRASKSSPTCKTWLGVGIANYFLENFEDCEVALIQANEIDCEDPEVWGYFCLLSMALSRKEEFTQCYRMTMKNDLKNDKLWRLIKHAMNTFGYSSPTFEFNQASKNKECTC